MHQYYELCTKSVCVNLCGVLFHILFFGKRYIGCVQFSDPETKTKEGQPHLIVYILPVLIIDSYKGYSASK